MLFRNNLLRFNRFMSGGGSRSQFRNQSPRQYGPSYPPPTEQDPPVARITTGKTTVSVGTEVSFDGSKSTGSGLKYSWNLGDGANPATPTTPKTSCTYSSTGEKTVSLVVTDDMGVESEAATLNITVIALTLAANPETVTRGETATYTATVKPDDLNPTFTWDYTIKVLEGTPQEREVPLKGKRKTTENAWGGIMVKEGTLQVKAHIRGETFIEKLGVSVESRNWISDVPFERDFVSWGRPKPCANHDLGNFSYGVLYPQCDANTVASGPNKGLLYLVLRRHGAPADPETLADPETPELVQMLGLEGVCRPTWPPSLANPKDPSAPVAVSAPVKACINRHFRMDEDNWPDTWRAFRDAQAGPKAKDDDQAQYDEIVEGILKHEGGPEPEYVGVNNHYRQWHDIITEANPAMGIEHLFAIPGNSHRDLRIFAFNTLIELGVPLKAKMKNLNWIDETTISDQHPETYLQGPLQFPAVNDDDCQRRLGLDDQEEEEEE